MQNYLSHLPYIASALYLIGAFLPVTKKRMAYVITIAAWCLHGIALGKEVFAGEAIRVGFAMMLSSALWISMLVYIVENRNESIDSLRVLVLPQAALTAILPLFFPGSMIYLVGKPIMFPWHIGIAILAYSTLTIAAFHALLMYFQDLRLHKLRNQLSQQWLDKVIDRLPALMKMERILFLLVTLGFVLLTLTVFSGVIFSEQVLGVAFEFNHKTLFSILSWLLFAGLLIGRQWRGWRGKTVLRITLFGFISLLMAYVGSRFILEVLLHRSFS